MKVMILCGKYGMGHFNAALAIKEQLELDLENVEVQIEDFIAFAFPGIHKIMYQGFHFFTTKTPKFYSKAYNQVASNEHNPVYSQIMLLQLVRFLKIHNPDVIVCTLPEIARIVSLYKKKYKSNIPLITSITDITTFYEWINYGSDLYLAPTNSVRKFLLQYGIKDETILISGIPVKQKFHHIQKIPMNKKQLLIMGGGLGNIPLDYQFYELLSKHDDIEVNVLCAKNVELYQYLLNRYNNIFPVSFCNNVDEYMSKADLVITKTGGITTFECIYSKLPVLTYIPFLPQEKRNAEFLERKKLGKIMWDNDKNPYELVISLFSSDEVKEMTLNMEYIRNQFDLSYSQRIKELYERGKK